MLGQNWQADTLVWCTRTYYLVLLEQVQGRYRLVCGVPIHTLHFYSLANRH